MVRGPARPHIVSRLGTKKWGARGPSGRLASAKLVIHVKYSIFIYLLFICMLIVTVNHIVSRSNRIQCI